MAIVPIHLPHHSYEIHIQPGLIDEAGQRIHDLSPHARCALIADATVYQIHGQRLKAGLEAAGYEVITHLIPSGEQHKNLAEIEKAWHTMLDHRLERKSPVIALGGGVVGDMAGFIAATYLRGVPFIQVPTTLLAMVDASVGGKTGINTPHGKNLIGAFNQPQIVIMDPLLLQTLPPRQLRSGMAECIKHGVIRDADLFQWLNDNAAQLLMQNPGAMVELLKRNVQIKAKVVMEDEKEAGVRAHLNLGHTFAHAIEATAGYGELLHGEAVALGMVAAAQLAETIELAPCGLTEKIKATNKALSLPNTATLVETAKLIEVMRLDKKAKDDRIRLVLPDQLGNVVIRDDVSDECIAKAWEYIRHE